MPNSSSSIARAALPDRPFPQLFDIIACEAWLPTLEALREAHGYVPDLSEEEVGQIEDQIKAALPAELRDGYRRLSDHYLARAVSEMDAFFAVGVEYGKRN